MTLGDFSGADFLHWAEDSKRRRRRRTGNYLQNIMLLCFMNIYIHTCTATNIIVEKLLAATKAQQQAFGSLGQIFKSAKSLGLWERDTRIATCTNGLETDSC